MTRLVCSIFASDDVRLREDVVRARRGGADAVEVRIDGLAGDPSWIAAVIAENTEFEFILTCRGRAEGGLSDDAPAERLAAIRRAAGGCDVCIDFEWADWPAVRAEADWRHTRAEANWRHPRAEADFPRLILSSHRFDGVTPDAVAWVRQVLATDATAIAKIAWRPHDIRDNVVAAEAMIAGGGRASAICMEEDGIPSRVLAPKWRGYVTYCCLDASSRTAPGQLTLDEMVNLYRVKSITPDTRVFGVIGDPVAHSMSPVVFNPLFKRHGLDAVYLPCRVPAGELRPCLDALRSSGRFDLGGFSVTMPHKIAAGRLGGPGFVLVGTANTLTPTDDDLWTRHNTDTWAASGALNAVMPLKEAQETRVDILGGGGTACALANWPPLGGERATLFARDPAKCAPALSGGSKVRPWEDRLDSSGGILINATPIGMWPNVDETPMPRIALRRYTVVFDAVYNPPETRLLREAREVGCRTVSGVEMFVYQAAFQFAIWTGLNAGSDEMRRVVLAELARRQAERDGDG